jgi:hypothetical protein
MTPKELEQGFPICPLSMACGSLLTMKDTIGSLFPHTGKPKF